MVYLTKNRISREYEELSSDHHSPYNISCVVAYTYNSSAGKAETGRFLGTVTLLVFWNR